MDFKQRISEVPADREILDFMLDQKYIPDIDKSKLGSIGFSAIPLDQLGLPPAEDILRGLLELEKTYPPSGWRTRDYVSQVYTGISTVYNKDYIESEVPLHTQTLGSSRLSQFYGKSKGMDGLFKQSKNSYYDSYGFRNVLPEFRTHLDIYNKFHGADSRGRFAYIHQHLVKLPHNLGWHVDEFPYHILRINIPLRTTEEHILEIEGEDDCGFGMSAKYHLEPGYGYIWNTRIPHRTTITKESSNTIPRIHLIMGICPWLEYVSEDDSYIPSKNWGIPVDKIVNERLFIK